MGIDHGRAYVMMAQQLLRRSYVIAVFKKMRSKGLPKRMTTRPFINSCLSIASLTAFCKTDS
jgi:hypothetical protein